MEVGVIGLGNMGAAIAAQLIEAGHDVTVYNRTEEKAEALMALGATLSHDPEGAAQGDVVITMLANDHAVESVAFGDGTEGSDGFITHQSDKTIHISMSTISTSLTKRMVEESAKLGKPMIAAPVMGRPDVAERGELLVMPAGDAKLIEKCQPVFDAIGRGTYVVGAEPVQAAVVKLAANFMLSSMIETLGEAFALVRKNGVDQKTFHEIMSKEFFKSPIYEKYGDLIANEKYDGGAFTVLLQEKDTRLALNAAIESQVPMPILAVIENAFLSAIGRGKGKMDPCAIAQVAAENAGL